MRAWHPTAAGGTDAADGSGGGNARGSGGGGGGGGGGGVGGGALNGDDGDAYSDAYSDAGRHNFRDVSLRATGMRLVPLPNGGRVAGRGGGAMGSVGGGGGGGVPLTSDDGKYMQDRLHYDHGVEVPVKCVNGSLHVRISAHLYNRLDDYERLAAAVLKVAAGRV